MKEQNKTEIPEESEQNEHKKSEKKLTEKGKYEKLDNMLAEVRDYCIINKIPMMATYAREKSTGKTEYTDTIVTPAKAGVELTDDRISSLNVAFRKGFYINIRDNRESEMELGKDFEEMINYEDDE